MPVMLVPCTFKLKVPLCPAPKATGALKFRTAEVGVGVEVAVGAGVRIGVAVGFELPLLPPPQPEMRVSKGRKHPARIIKTGISE